MNDNEVKMECLRLAEKMAGGDAAKALELAEKFARFVLGNRYMGPLQHAA